MLIWAKYVILVLFVILLPLLVVDFTGQGDPWFCKYICPSGTLAAGIPLVLLNENLKLAVGNLFFWKVAILIVLIILALWVYRPFCKYLCPLGAIYSFFNPVALYRYQIDESACTKCGKCKKACKMDIKVWEKPNSLECIRLSLIHIYKDRGRKSRGVFAKESACVDVPAGGTFQLGRILLKCHEFFLQQCRIRPIRYGYGAGCCFRD